MSKLGKNTNYSIFRCHNCSCEVERRCKARYCSCYFQEYIIQGFIAKDMSIHIRFAVLVDLCFSCGSCTNIQTESTNYMYINVISSDLQLF